MDVCGWCGSARSRKSINLASGSFGLSQLRTSELVFRFCDNCGAYSQMPFPTTDDLNSLYGDEYSPYVSSPLFRYSKKIISHPLNAISEWSLRRTYQSVHGSHLLDFSAGTLNFAKNRQRENYVVSVTDINDRLKSESALNSISFSVSDDASIRAVQTTQYNIVHAAHVIEHSRNPKKLLSDLFALVAPGGVLHISFPNSNSLLVRLFPNRCLRHFDPTHLVLPNGSEIELYVKGVFPDSSTKRIQESSISDVLRFLTSSYHLESQKTFFGIFRYVASNLICIITRVARRAEREHLLIVKNYE